MGGLFPSVGVILAGGKSRRFGKDKAWAIYRGQPFVSRLFSLLSKLFPEVFVVLHQQDPRYEPMPILLDSLPEGGPMNGIYSALQKTEAGAMMVTACDLPLLEVPLLSALRSAWRPEDRALVCFHRGRWEPLCGIYSQALLPALEEALKKGNYRLQDFLNQVDARPFSALPSSAEKLLWNVNTPHDMIRLKREIDYENLDFADDGIDPGFSP